jgi:uncharacterized protein (UPF0248 family)
MATATNLTASTEQTSPPPISPVERPTYQPSPFITSLRALAQSHLSEIAAELIAEDSSRLSRNLQLQLYAKPAHLPRPPQHQIRHQEIKSTSRSASRVEDADTEKEIDMEEDTTGEEKQKLPPLRPVSDVLNRLRHDPILSANLDEYVIGYLERFDGMCEIPVEKWVSESTHEEFVPQHRIRYIIRRRQGDDELVWGRDGRIDRIFGSGADS